MQVKTKYKQTEIGLIPEDWVIGMGSGITDIVSKGASPKWQGFNYTHEGMLFVTSENVRDGFLDVSHPKYLPLEFHEKLKRSKLQKGDILINLVGASIGRSCLVSRDLGEANVNQAVAVFRVKESYWPPFISYYFQAPSTVDRILSMQVDVARPNISLTDLRKFLLPLPPPPEQRAIATALSDVDALINSLDRLIAKKRGIKQAAMQQLLTGKTRLPGFTGEWECKCLGDLFSITAGGDFDPKLSSATRNEKFQYPVYSNSLSNYGFYGYCTYAAQSAGSITVTARGTLGAANYRAHDFTAIGRVLVLKPKEELDGLYFAEYINNRIQFAIESTGVPQLTAPQISKYQIEFPVYKEQIEISRVLTVMAQELMTLEQRRDKTLLLKQGMMQELLTGRTRLV
jgi:type I restriction enzyme S subunit